MGVKTDVWGATGWQHVATTGGTITLTESSRGIIVGVEGSLACELVSLPNTVAYFPLISAGNIHPLEITKIYGSSSGTSANSIVTVW
jgi:hypothetical protein